MVKLRFRYPQSGTSTLAPGSRSCLNPPASPYLLLAEGKNEERKEGYNRKLKPDPRSRFRSPGNVLCHRISLSELARQYLPLLELLNKREGEPSSCQCRRLCLAVTRYGRLKLGAHRRSKLEGQNPVGILQLRGRSERFCGSSGLAAR